MDVDKREIHEESVFVQQCQSRFAPSGRENLPATAAQGAEGISPLLVLSGALRVESGYERKIKKLPRCGNYYQCAISSVFRF